VGKPNTYAIELIMKENNITDKSRMIMIGDRPDTDILMANNAGIASCLVFTGVVKTEDEVDWWVK
jgi:ribonucleotide monophosphatase NagD (HAD superfamily)